MFFQISKLIETLEKQLSDKGVEINAYMAKHNIQVMHLEKGVSYLMTKR
jgi:hypothetical protein